MKTQKSEQRFVVIKDKCNACDNHHVAIIANNDKKYVDLLMKIIDITNSLPNETADYINGGQIITAWIVKPEISPNLVKFLKRAKFIQDDPQKPPTPPPGIEILNPEGLLLKIFGPR